MGTRGLKGLAIALAATALVSCTGGEMVAGIGSGGTGVVSSGPITGFGSVIVGGVRFDDTAARVTIDGVPDRPVSDLRLGMVVEVRGDIDPGGTTGRASEIAAGYTVLGPVTDVQASAATFTVLGQRVRVDAATILDGVSSVSALAIGDGVAVSGLPDAATGAIVATRLERRAAAAPEAQSQGTVSDLTARTFRLGALVVDWSAAQLSGVTAATLANGAQVAASGTLDATGVLKATTVRAVATPPPPGAFVEYVGYVSAFASVQSFKVGTVTVNAATARFEGGSAGMLANGLRVEVEGRIVDGVLVAEEVDFLTTGTEVAAEVQGAITDFLSVASFRVREQLVDASGAAFTGGNGRDAANGRVVKVVGMLRGTVLVASSVAFLDSMPAEATRLALDGTITDFASPASFKVTGIPVSTSAATVFSGGGAGDLAAGRHVAVEGTVMANVLNAATVRIYPVEATPLVSTSGRIESFVSPASFVVAGQKVSATSQTQYGGGTASSLANGVSVQVTGRIANGILVATQIEIRTSTETPSNAEVEGYITNFVSAADFKVNGQRVDATGARYEHGTAATLANGVKVHCTGTISSGVLKASLVQIDM